MNNHRLVLRAVVVLALAAVAFPANASASGFLVQRSPNVRHRSNLLYGVAKVPGRHVEWAVGTYKGGSSTSERTLILRNRGHGWKRVLSPNVGKGNRLTFVSARSLKDVWAVGDRSPIGISHPLAVHWNGRGLTAYAPQVSGSAYFAGIASLGRRDAWAVGAVETGLSPCGGPGSTQLLMHFTGRWHAVSLPAFEGASSALSAITRIPHTRHLVAIGGVCGGGDEEQTEILRFDGAHWHAAPSPAPAGYQAVAAASGRDMLLVGSVFPPGAHSLQPVAAHWNGSTWSYKVFPLPGRSTFAAFESVCHVGNTRTYLVAGERDTAVGELPLIAARSRGWRYLSAPAPNRFTDLTNSIACGGSGQAWTAGWRSPSIAKTFILHRR